MYKHDFFYIFTIIKSSIKYKFYRPTLNRKLKNQTSHGMSTNIQKNCII